MNSVRGGVAPDGVRFGVITDTHVAGRGSMPELARAFAFMRDKGVDAVLHCGDMTDFGYIDELEAFSEAWKREMPPDVPLVPVLGNRDLSDTKRMSDERRRADRDKLIVSAPEEHLRRVLGLELEDGMRVRIVKGIPVVAMDWGKEHLLEKFMMRHPELRDPLRPFIQVQHRHPGGMLGDAPCNDPATCWLNMFPRSISASGHSHRPFTDRDLFRNGPFTAFGAGSYYLSDGPQQKGIREVSLLTVRSTGMELERFGFHNGFHDVKTVIFPSPPAGDKHVDGSFVFVQWNVGGFTLGQGGFDGGCTKERAEAFRLRLDGLGADFLGLSEYDPSFAMADRPVRDLVFGDYPHITAGPRLGLNGTAMLSRRHPLRDIHVHNFHTRKQPRYCTVCEADVDGRRTTFVETHLDLDAACRKTQIAELLEICGPLQRVMLSGDFNVSTLVEFAPFASSGFKMANGGQLGTFRTHRRRNSGYDPAIDNVMVKGFDIVGAWTADDAMILSDHRILACRLKAI
jgi:endonuclease/exonuclease/phosphatase family metal-dependent hydrolase/predicted phosphodiesterase